MSNSHKDKMESAVARVAAEYLRKTLSGKELVTVTRCEVSDDLSTATIAVSVLPEDARDDVLHALKRLRSNFREELKTKTRMRYVPHVEFAVDPGEQNRQKIDDLLAGS